MKHLYRHLFVIATCIVVILTNRVQSTSAGGTGHMPAKEIDLQEVVQLVIDLPSLQQYYHDDITAKRRPLVITGKFMSKSLVLKKFGQKVLILSGKAVAQKKIKDYLDFTRIVIRKQNAEVTFGYPNQGLQVYVQLNKQDGSWKIANSRLVEY